MKIRFLYYTVLLVGLSQFYRDINAQRKYPGAGQPSPFQGIALAREDGVIAIFENELASQRVPAGTEIFLVSALYDTDRKKNIFLGHLSLPDLRKRVQEKRNYFCYRKTSFPSMQFFLYVVVRDKNKRYEWQSAYDYLNMIFNPDLKDEVGYHPSYAPFFFTARTRTRKQAFALTDYQKKIVKIIGCTAGVGCLTAGTRILFSYLHPAEGMADAKKPHVACIADLSSMGIVRQNYSKISDAKILEIINAANSIITSGDCALKKAYVVAIVGEDDKVALNQEQLRSIDDFADIANAIITKGIVQKFDPACEFIAYDFVKYKPGDERNRALNILAQELPKKWTEMHSPREMPVSDALGPLLSDIRNEVTRVSILTEIGITDPHKQGNITWDLIRTTQEESDGLCQSKSEALKILYLKEMLSCEVIVLPYASNLQLSAWGSIAQLVSIVDTLIIKGVVSGTMDATNSHIITVDDGYTILAPQVHACKSYQERQDMIDCLKRVYDANPGISAADLVSMCSKSKP